jgi:hypothetical protein
MKIKAIEQLLFKVRGISVPVVRVSNIDENGRIGMIQFLGHVKKRPNSLVNTWDATAWEIDKKSHPVSIVNEKGIQEVGFVVSESGETVDVSHKPIRVVPKIETTDLYTTPSAHPNLERVIGAAATLDDITDGLDLGKSMKNVLIGIMVGAPLWWIIFKILGIAQ